LLDIRREHPGALATLILRTLVLDGRLSKGAVSLIHARPGDAQTRGKMERFWRTLRESCLDHLGAMTSLHDVQARLLVLLDEHYHRAPHGGLFGASTRLVDELALADRAHHADPASRPQGMRTRRRVRKDGTLDVDGTRAGGGREAAPRVAVKR
jgi:hypothetical protein